MKNPKSDKRELSLLIEQARFLIYQIQNHDNHRSPKPRLCPGCKNSNRQRYANNDQQPNYGL